MRSGASPAYPAVPKSQDCRPHLNRGGAEHPQSVEWSFPCLFCGTQVTRVVRPWEPGSLGASVERPILHIFEGGGGPPLNVQRIVRVPHLEGGRGALSWKMPTTVKLQFL